MKTSKERILTTHTGSIARPDGLISIMREKENGRPYDEAAFDAAVRSAVAECVRLQCAAGLDVVNDGEQGKSGFTTYQEERLSGFDPVPVEGPARMPWREVAEFPEYYERYFKTNMGGAALGPSRNWVCSSPVSYIGGEAVQRDIDNLNAALEGSDLRRGVLICPHSRPASPASRTSTTPTGTSSSRRLPTRCMRSTGRSSMPDS